MARDFESSSANQWLSRASAIASGYPFTFACWIKPESNTFGTIFSISVTGSADNFHALQVAGSSVLRYRCRTTGNSDALSIATVSNGTWYFVGMVGASATDRRVWLNTVRADQIANRTPTGFDATTIGRNNAATADYFDGIIALPTFWSSALSDSDMTALANGQPPQTMQTGSLVFYLPLTGASPEVDPINGNNFTVNGSPAFTSDSPPIDQTITGTGFADSDAFGGGAITTRYTITGAGFADADAFGSGAITSRYTITGTGFANASQFGEGTVTNGSTTQTITGTGFESVAQFRQGSVSVISLIPTDGWWKPKKDKALVEIPRERDLVKEAMTRADKKLSPPIEEKESELTGRILEPEIDTELISNQLQAVMEGEKERRRLEGEEEARIAKEKREAEEREAARLEAERIEAERIMAERLEAQRKEAIKTRSEKEIFELVELLDFLDTEDLVKNV